MRRGGQPAPGYLAGDVIDALWRGMAVANPAGAGDAAVSLLGITARRPVTVTLLRAARVARGRRAAMHEGLTGALQRIGYALHVLCAAWWFGGLVPLLMLMRMAKEVTWCADAITAMMRFSRYGHIAVAGVIATGIVNSVFILGISWPLHSGYVRLLALKIALVAVMVAIALINRYVLVPNAARRGDRADRRERL